MVKVKKVLGEFPIEVAVLAEVVSFDAEGNAEVSEEVAEVLEQIPGYEVEMEASEADNEDEGDQTPEAPKKPAPPKKSPTKPRN